MFSECTHTGVKMCFCPSSSTASNIQLRTFCHGSRHQIARFKATQNFNTLYRWSPRHQHSGASSELSSFICSPLIVLQPYTILAWPWSVQFDDDCFRTYLTTESKGQSLYREANSCSAGQEIPHRLFNPRIYHFCMKSRHRFLSESTTSHHASSPLYEIDAHQSIWLKLYSF